MTAWRFWLIHHGHLVSPHMAIPLPLNGITTATCTENHTPPAPGCHCGICAYLMHHDIRTVLDRLDHNHLAITKGIATRPFTPDTRKPIYWNEHTNQWIVLPVGLRARKLQPWCGQCGSTANLTVNHTPEMWTKVAEGKALTLKDVAEQVMCQRCNNAYGKARNNE